MRNTQVFSVFLIFLTFVILSSFAFGQACQTEGHGPVCGSNGCESGESCSSCPQDCGVPEQGNPCNCGGSGVINGCGSCVGGVPTPNGYGQPCNCDVCGCGGTIQCDGTCSGSPPAPPNYGEKCGACVDGMIDCAGACVGGSPGGGIPCNDACGGPGITNCDGSCTGHLNPMIFGDPCNINPCGPAGTFDCTPACTVGDPTPAGFGDTCNCGPCGCGGTINCGAACSGADPAPPTYGNACMATGTIICDGTCSELYCGGSPPPNYGDSCGACGTIDCLGACVGEAGCTPGATQCSGGREQKCDENCGWVDVGTDGDADGTDFACGDSLCDTNSPGIFDATRLGTEDGGVGTCTDGLDNDCDGVKDCQDPDCLAGPASGCCNVAADCAGVGANQCRDDVCVENFCMEQDRVLTCDNTECGGNSFCNVPGGVCTDPDNDQSLCMSCATDLTAGYSWNSSVHEDANISFSENTNVYNTLFDSDGALCFPNCFSVGGGNIPHENVAGSPNCCGDDPNEFYKRDFFGGECVDNVNDCVWSEGDAQQHHTGNRSLWCYSGEWEECSAPEHLGKTLGPGPVITCAGDITNVEWTPPGGLLGENFYSCEDDLDNDGDTFIDSQDPDCDGNIAGYVNESVSNVTFIPLENARVEIWTTGGLMRVFDLTQIDGWYATPTVPFGVYDVVVRHPDYAPAFVINLTIGSGQTSLNFFLKSSLACQSDCTFVGDVIIHKECANVSGCTFYDGFAALACDNAKLGWRRDYPPNPDEYIECPSSPPIPKVTISSSTTTCTGGEKTVVKLPSVVRFKGQPANMVVVSCG